MGVSHRYPYIVLMPQFVLSPITVLKLFVANRKNLAPASSEIAGANFYI